MPKKKSNPVHQYTLFDAASETSKCLVEGCPSVLKGNHGSNLLRHFLAHHPETYSKMMKKNNQIQSIKEKLPSSAALATRVNSKPKPLPSYFSVVREACIDLVRYHGLPVSLFDCIAFKNILNVINMKRYERGKICSKHIEQSVMRKRGETLENDEDASSEVEKENGLEISKNEETPSKKRERNGTIKSENAVSNQCSCNTDDTSKHSLDCAADCTQEYNHLDDEAFEAAPNGPGSSVSSHEDTEEIYLPDDFISDVTKTPPEPPKKRRKPEFPLKDPIRPRDNGQEEEIKLSEEITKSLDRFGLYIASLMMFLPNHRRIKCQGHIVQRLLQEQLTSAA